MRKLLLGLFLGLLAVVHSTPVPTGTQVPVNNEDEVFREAMTDGFLVPSLTTEKPTTTTEASQQTESTSSADNGSRDSSFTTNSPKTNATAPASQQPESEEFEGSAQGVTYAFWYEGSTTTTSTQEAADATESTTTTSTQEAFGATESTTTTSTQEAFGATESTTKTSTQEASSATESTTSMQEAFGATESTTKTSTQDASDASESTTTTTTSMQEAFGASESTTSEHPTKQPAQSTTVEASQEPDFMSDDSILGESEDAFSWLGSSTTSISTDSPTSSVTPNFWSGDDESIPHVTVDLLGSELGSGIMDEPTISKTARGRGVYMANPEILVEKPEKVVEQQDPEQHKGHSTPGWIIIVGFIVGVAALVMLCLAIATRDKWNGPRQASPTKTEANPSNQQRGLEMETFLSREEPKENGKAAEYTVIPLDELSESYS